eukprot:TRINITY_DN30199_c0_g1_i1.p1 TRINITY_DN30199_c0_g1~~TRINITY_DN30199_c0_g1_i1.p1  ORF type:complete len:497 (+),score=35.38 TRINITY_DN30199_c0_g1_i1:60-1550(+)
MVLREATSLGAVARSMKACLAATLMFWSMQWTQTDLASAFIRALVVCSPPMPHGGTCVSGTFYRDGACLPIPPGHHGWSGSPYCYDRNFVVTRSLEVGGWVSTVGTLSQILASLFVGVVVIDSIGRRPAMLLALLGCSSCAACFFLVCLLPRPDWQVSCLLLAGFTGHILNSFEPASKAMASDLAERDTVQRAMRFTALSASQSLAICGGFLGGFLILASEISDYTIIWSSLTALGIIFSLVSHFTLKESLTQEARDSLQGDIVVRSGIACCRPIAELIASFRIVWNDNFLRYSLITTFLTNMAIYGAVSVGGGWAIAVVGYNQAVASLAGVVQPASILIGNFASVLLLERIGCYYANFVGHAILTLALFIVALGGPWRSASGSLYWVGWALAGLSIGIIAPAGDAIASVRVGNSVQGKLFSAAATITLLGVAMGNFVWSNYLFVVQANPWRVALPWFASASIVSVSLVLAITLYIVYIIPETKATAIASSTPLAA